MSDLFTSICSVTFNNNIKPTYPYTIINAKNKYEFVSLSKKRIAEFIDYFQKNDIFEKMMIDHVMEKFDDKNICEFKWYRYVELRNEIIAEIHNYHGDLFNNKISKISYCLTNFLNLNFLNDNTSIVIEEKFLELIKAHIFDFLHRDFNLTTKNFVEDKIYYEKRLSIMSTISEIEVHKTKINELFV